MNSLQNEVASISFLDDKFIITLSDGRRAINPLTKKTFPRLWYATPEERSRYECIAGTIHWPDLNEDARIQDLLDGTDNSGESQRSIANWLESLQEFRQSPSKEIQTFTEWHLRRRGAWNPYQEYPTWQEKT